MTSNSIAGKVLIAVSLMLLAASAAPAQDRGQGELLQKMVSLVVAHNPILVSQQRVVDEAQRIPDRVPGLTIPVLNFGTGLYTVNPVTFVPTFLPTVTLSVSVSFSDPNRDLIILKVKEEKELARQGWETARDTALATLFSKVRDILKLKSQGKNLQALRSYLHDYSALAESQRTEQAISPDKVWDLRERIADVDTQLDTLDGQIETAMLEVAMSLGGDAWQELLGLLRQISA
jgi:hypothetical protein